MKNEEQSSRVKTKLKFTKSDKTGAYVAFVSQNTVTKRVMGVRPDSDCPKKICIIDKDLAHQIIPGVLYDATLIPMKEKNGYIAIEITPVSFDATFETSYVPKAVYRIEVKFGNQTILFDPKDGKKDSVRTVKGVRDILEGRLDIKNLSQVIDEFMVTSEALLERFEKDGYFVSRKQQCS